MIKYFELISFPSRALDKLNDKEQSFLSLYLISTVAFLGLSLPQFISKSVNSPNGLLTIMTYLIVIPLMYYPVNYISGYCYYFVSKGFKGVSSFKEMRNLVAFSFCPFLVQFFISISFISVGLIKNDTALVTHENYLTHLILWLLSFRIIMVGIAKYNKFNWIITLITYMISTSILGGFTYLFIQLKK